MDILPVELCVRPLVHDRGREGRRGARDLGCAEVLVPIVRRVAPHQPAGSGGPLLGLSTGGWVCGSHHDVRPTGGRDDRWAGTLRGMWYVGGIAIGLVLVVVLVMAAAKVMRKP